jgi:hypothetical protein
VWAGFRARANYSEIAETYDVARKIWDKDLDAWLGIVRRYVDEEDYDRKVRFLDLGGAQVGLLCRSQRGLAIT